MSADLAELASRLGHVFQDPNLLVRALTHSSWATEHSAGPGVVPSHNERLEFLGDAVLGFLVSAALAERFPDSPPGKLTKWRAYLVRAERLHRAALAIDLGSYLVLGRGEEASGGRAKKALLADAVEALIAALYLDGGIDAARRFVERYVIADFDPETAERGGPMDSKSALQEYAIAAGLPLPRYTTLREEGPGHARVFAVEVRIGRNWTATGTGSSKKSASQAAARALLEELRKRQSEAGEGLDEADLPGSAATPT